MSSDYDYIVVGAGIEGSWTALQLVREQKGRVLLLEQFPLPHSRGSSHGQTRIIRHAYSERFHAELMPGAYQEWFKLEEEVGEKLFVPMPLLCVANESGYKHLDATLDSLRAVLPGQEGTKFRELTSADLAREFPQAKFGDKHRGCVEECAGILLADRCLAAVQRRFRQLGGEIRDSVQVTSLTPGPRVIITMATGVNKVLSQITANKVAVCAGPWTSKLLDPLVPQKLPLTPLRVNVYYWKIKENSPGAIRASYIDLGDNGEFWGIPEYEYPGMVKFVHPTHLVADPDTRECLNVELEHKELKEICSLMSQHFPGIENKPAVIETCMYTMTPDHVSIIDTLPGHKNIAFACGLSGTGFKKSPAVGNLVKSLLLETPSTLCSHAQHLANPDIRDQSLVGDHDSISRYIDKTFPGLENSPSILETCMYTMTPDNVSIIDHVPGCRNLVFACGFSGTGFKKGPAVGKLIRDMLNSNNIVPRAQPYSLYRFSKLNSKI